MLYKLCCVIFPDHAAPSLAAEFVNGDLVISAEILYLMAGLGSFCLNSLWGHRLEW